MVGSFRILLYNKRISYDITVNRKISIIRGFSGTGKSTLAIGIAKAINDKSFKLSCDVQVVSVPHMSEEDTIDYINKRSNTIIFIDEDIACLRTHRFADTINKSDCYFVIITRDKLSSIPYSVDSVYEIVTNSNNKHTLKRIYEPVHTNIKPDYIVNKE